ncbi:MAG: NRDE family protein [Rhodocyclaceae bacterium]|jgi:uncharacterized protein with NRDE domain|nr:NRDE family protein [Rhodocyclaceae bacterium]
MCLILIAWQQHPEYPLVIAANRDEFFQRPTLAAHWWSRPPGILAGRDLEAGGTWLGLTRSGRFAALTNYRDPSQHRPGAPSRGALVRDCLLGEQDTEGTLARIAAQSTRYAGFNLIFSDGQRLGVHESTTGRIRLLAPGCYGLSNHLLDTPWPKLTLARERFGAALNGLPGTRDMLQLLTDDRPAPAHALPNTGVSADWEHWLSSVFVRAPGYGTRCSTLVTLSRTGQASFREWSWDEAGTLAGDMAYSFFTEQPG